MIEQTLVIGSTGFLGRHVVAHLVEAGRTVVGMRRWDSRAALFDELGVPDIVANLDDLQELAYAISGINHIIYCAAPDVDLEPREYQRRAVEWIRNVMQVARDEDVDRLVVTSTAATVAPVEAGAGEEELPGADDVYLPGSAGDHFVEAAYAVEQEVFRQAADGQEIVILNPTVILGPGARLPAYGSLSDVAPTAPVNWVDVREVSRRHVQAVDRGGRGQRYLVAGENTTLEALYEEVERHEGVETFGNRVFGDGAHYRNRHLLARGQWVDAGKTERILGK